MKYEVKLRMWDLGDYNFKQRVVRRVGYWF